MSVRNILIPSGIEFLNVSPAEVASIGIEFQNHELTVARVTRSFGGDEEPYGYETATVYLYARCWVYELPSEERMRELRFSGRRRSLSPSPTDVPLGARTEEALCNLLNEERSRVMATRERDDRRKYWKAVEK